MQNKLDFTKIKGDSIEAQRSIFERLICYIASFDDSGGEFRRIKGDGGDGGVEAIRILPSGQKIGYQAKYYTSGNIIDWGNITESVKTALVLHPELDRYVIALPCYFTGKKNIHGGTTEGTWGKWDEKVKEWEKLAFSLHIEVKFEPWTAFEIEASLLQPKAQHLIRTFFDRDIFTREWMKRHMARTIHDLQARYSPDEHVDTESLKAFDVIYHRENICKDLQAIFDVASKSNPCEAIALVENSGISTDVQEADIIAAEESKKEFLALGEALDWPADRGWPIGCWLTSWYTLTQWLKYINQLIWNHTRTEKTSDYNFLSRVSEKIMVNELIGPQVFGGKWANVIPIDGSRAAIFVGRAGAGKSHVLARGAETAWNAGAPVIHILGQHILDDDPRTAILKRLEIPNWTFYEALTALNLAAEISETRALLIIDAINDGHGINVWRNNIASFIHEINEHDRIVLVMSCREEYLHYIIPQELIANPQMYPEKDGEPPQDCSPLGKFVYVSVDGFRTEEERELALQKFHGCQRNCSSHSPGARCSSSSILSLWYLSADQWPTLE